MSIFGNNHKTEDFSKFPESSDQLRWEALVRGQILNATTAKFFNYIALVDQKAQAMIILNSILVPVALNWVQEEQFHWPATITILVGVLTIFFCIICIYPKRRGGSKPDGSVNLLHFGDIGKMKEDQFVQEFLPIFNNLSDLSEAAVKDIHDVARRIILPKFRWLKLAYMVFFLGNFVSIALVLYAIWIPT